MSKPKSLPTGGSGVTAPRESESNSVIQMLGQITMPESKLDDLLAQIEYWEKIARQANRDAVAALKRAKIAESTSEMAQLVEHTQHALELWRDRALAAEFECTHDSMTGALNRKGLFAAYDAKIHTHVTVVDVDGLKALNDTFGHAAGDKLIIKVAGQLMSVSGVNVHVARTGGDEFVVLSDGKIRFTDTTHFSHGGVKFKELENLDSAIERADAKMYTRKLARKATR